MPTISLGLPVHNGEAFLEKCLNSIRAQTFEDFELLISDNASTDNSYQICRRHEAEDSRIRVVRQEQNIGAANNFNLLFHHTTAEFFKWCAHDDLLEPTFLAETLDVLRRCPEAALCHTQTVIHDLEREAREVFTPAFSRMSADPVSRLSDVIDQGQRCYEVFGLIRRSVLEQTALIGNHKAGDNVLLFRLALLGSFEIVEKPLFVLGRHNQQSTALVKNSQAYQRWFTGGKRRIPFPDWEFAARMWRVPKGIPLSASERCRCYWLLLKETYRLRARLRQNIRVAVETMIFGDSDPLRRRRFFDGNT